MPLIATPVRTIPEWEEEPLTARFQRSLTLLWVHGFVSDTEFAKIRGKIAKAKVQAEQPRTEDG